MAEIGHEVSGNNFAYKVNIYEPTSTTTYLCIAAPGSTTSSERWRILKIDTSTTGTTLISFAGGTRNFDKIADDRATYSFS